MLTCVVWYFFNDVYPPLHNGHKPFDPPAWWFRIIDGRWPTQEIPATEETPATNVGLAAQHREHPVPAQTPSTPAEGTQTPETPRSEAPPEDAEAHVPAR